MLTDGIEHALRGVRTRITPFDIAGIFGHVKVYGINTEVIVSYLVYRRDCSDRKCVSDRSVLSPSSIVQVDYLIAVAELYCIRQVKDIIPYRTYATVSIEDQIAVIRRSERKCRIHILRGVIHVFLKCAGLDAFI